jgi:hypothetical protein
MKTIKFEVTSQSKQLDKVGELMSIMDLGITGIEFPIKEVFSWKTDKVIDSVYINKAKEAIRGAVEAGEYRVISIKKIR